MLGCVVVAYLILQETAKLFSLSSRTLYTPTSNVSVLGFSSFSPALGVIISLLSATLTGEQCYFLPVLLCTSLMTNNGELLFMCFFAICFL